MKKLAVFALALLLTVTIAAQEKLTLNSAVFTSAGVTDFRVESVYLRRDTGPDSPAEVRATFREVVGTVFVANGRALTCRYDGAEAETLLRTINTLNLSTISLEKRITQKCQTDGKLGAGVISGTPQ